MRFFLALMFCLCPALVQAAEAREEVSYAGAMLQMVMALAIVLALLLLLYWIMRKFSPRQMLGQGAGGLKVWARLGLGARKSLVLVEAGRKMLVLGLGEKEISLLREIDDQEEIKEIKANSGFARLAKKTSFMNILKGKQNHDA